MTPKITLIALVLSIAIIASNAFSSSAPNNPPGSSSTPNPPDPVKPSTFTIPTAPSSATAPNNNNKAGQMEDVVRKYFDGVNKQDPEQIKSCFSDKATIRDVCGINDSTKDVVAQDLADWCMEFVTAHPDCKVLFHYGPECGRNSRWVVAHWYETGTWTGKSCNVEPTGQPMRVEGQTRFKINDELKIEDMVVTRNFTEWEKATLENAQQDTIAAAVPAAVAVSPVATSTINTAASKTTTKQQKQGEGVSLTGTIGFEPASAEFVKPVIGKPNKEKVMLEKNQQNPNTEKATLEKNQQKQGEGVSLTGTIGFQTGSNEFFKPVIGKPNN